MNCVRLCFDELGAVLVAHLSVSVTNTGSKVLRRL